MNDGLIGFLLGFFTGSTFGIFCMALMSAARFGDDTLFGNERGDAHGEDDKSADD